MHNMVGTVVGTYVYIINANNNFRNNSAVYWIWFQWHHVVLLRAER